MVPAALKESSVEMFKVLAARAVGIYLDGLREFYRLTSWFRA